MIFVGVLAGISATISPAMAAVVVIENRTTDQIDFAIRQSEGTEVHHSLRTGALQPIAAAGLTEITFDAGGQARRYRLRPNSIHYFATRGQDVDLFAWPLPAIGAPSRQAPNRVKSPAVRTPGSSDIVTIPVKILVDDAEPTVRAVWEKRLRAARGCVRNL